MPTIITKAIVIGAVIGLCALAFATSNSDSLAGGVLSVVDKTNTELKK